MYTFVTQLLSLIPAVAILLAVFMAGSFLVSIFELESIELPGANLGLNMLVGLSFASALTIPFAAISSVNQSTSTIILTLILITALLSIRHTKQQNYYWRCMKTYLFDSNSNKIDLLFNISFGIFSCVWILFFLLNCALPETSWDALAYHIPKGFEFKLSFIPYFYASLPKGLDVIFWLGVALTKNFTVSKLMHFAYVIAILTLCVSAAYHLSGRLASRLTVAFFFLIYFTNQYGTTCYVDLGCASCELWAIISAAYWFKYNKTVYLNWSLLSVGASIGIKYQSLPVLALLCIFYVVIFFCDWENRKNAITPKNVIYGILLISVPGSFWYVKNMFVYGSPVWPFFFGHGGMSNTEYSNITKEMLSLYIHPRTLLNFCLLPIRLLTGNLMTYNGELGWKITYDLGVAFVIYVGACSVLRRGKDPILVVLVSFYFAIFTLNFWTGAHIDRYLLSATYLSLFLTAIVVGRIVKAKVRCLVATACVLALYYQSIKISDPAEGYRTIIEHHNISAYLAEAVDDYKLEIILETKNIKSNQVGYMFELRALRYFIDGDQLRNGDQINLDSVNSSEDVIPALRKSGVSYWCINSTTTDYRRDWVKRMIYLLPQDRDKLIKFIKYDDYIASRSKLVERRGENYVYELPTIRQN